MPPCSLRLERELLRDGCTTVAGIDEVGRGAIAGPVSVGVAVVTAGTRTAPRGLRDSKLLSPAQRVALFPRLDRWVAARAVGRSGPDEIDRWGLTTALRLAALRALSQVGPVDAVILDGSHDWLSAPAVRTAATPAEPELALDLDLTRGVDDPDPTPGSVPWPVVVVPRVHVMVKADLRCSSVAAASVLAKVTRDAEMVQLAGEADPYGWAVNKGYTTPAHADAVRRLGLCEQHRRSWRVAAAQGDEQCIDLTTHRLPNPQVVPT